MNNKIAVAIDGPAAAGKSTVAKALAEKLKFIYVDTGALYRAIALFVLGKGTDTENEKAVVPLLKEIDLKLSYDKGCQKVILNGKDVSEEIRIPEMSMAASNVSKIPQVREFLLDLQRSIAKNNNVIMDGRDIATVILPDAKYKIFLTATPEERANRRFLEFKNKGIKTDLNKLIKETKLRDYNDSHREIAPLRPHEQALIVDNTNMNFEQTVQFILNHLGSDIK